MALTRGVGFCYKFPVRPRRPFLSRALFPAAACLLSIGMLSCAPAARPALSVAKATAFPPGPSLIERSSDLFYSGKKAALSGDFDCAEAQFQLALNAVVPPAGPRPEAADVTEFSTSLYESIRRYEAMAESAGEADAPEARETPDELVGVSGQNSPAEVALAREEVKSDDRTSDFDLPVTVNEQVLNMVASFTSRPGVRRRFEEGLQRAGRYMPMIRGVLEREGLPKDLAYVAMIESSFKTRAHSRARAQGVWQFIGATGRRYGLRRTAVVDERSDPVKATEAAAGYFKDLHEIFNDWYLAMAAYDAGEGRIARAIARTGAETYWDLCRLGAIPKETRLYVPSVIAAALIAKNQSHYGFHVEAEPPVSFETVRLNKPVNIQRLARTCRLDAADLRELNPELRGSTTPKTPSGYELRVPSGAAAVVAERIGMVPAAPVPALRQHRVRKGETLARVARRYGVSVASLAEANDLSTRARLAPRRMLVIPERQASSRERKRHEPRRTAAAADAGGERRAAYSVRKGDTLYSIATSHHTTVQKLREWNRLDASNAIQPGDHLSLSPANP
ncbi:MAG: LysM peptidoglycan-binding domain-containing protein [Thermoanaerobaculia bacterium]